MKVIKKIFKYGVLVGYIILTIVLIVEASLPGNISAGQSNAVGDIITDITGNEFEKEPEYIHPTNLDISIIEKAKYLVGEVYHLDYSVTPSNSSNKSIIWESSNKSVATISTDGTLRLIAKGEVTIKATLKDTTFTDSLIINVEEIILEDFIITSDTIMDTNHEYTIHVDFIPSNATNRSLKWESSDPSVATINSKGHVVPKSAGIVTFSATSSNGVVKSITVEIKLIIINKVDVNHLSITDSVLTFTEGESKKLQINVIPSNATNKELKYISDNEDVITVDKYGKVTCIKDGYANILISSLSNPNVKTQIGIVVKSKVAEFKLLNELSENTLTLKPYESVKLDIEKTVMPVEYNFEYISNNNDICEISEDGVINGLEKGTTTIIIRCISGDGTVKEISFDVTVKKEIDNSAITNFYYMIRKGIGHFGAFFVLAIFASFVVIMFFKKKWLYALLSLVTGFLIAGLTEYIQTFVPGRSGLFKDVMIDYTGYIVGSIIILGVYLIIYLITRRTNGKQKS